MSALDRSDIIMTANPAAEGMVLSEEVRFYMLTLVPAGRLTRDEDITACLKVIFNTDRIEFERPIKKFVDYTYAASIIDNVPFHREVSALGYVSNPLYMERLVGEGFEILPKTKHRGPRVKDYKEYLFDFRKETDLDADRIVDIEINGIERLFAPSTISK